VFAVDGSVLEGGGQILRNSLAYSAILGYPVQIERIRAKRKTPGLAAQHLESFKLVRDVCKASFIGDKVGSTEVTFTPKCLAEGSFSADPKTAGAITLMVQASLFPLAFAGGTSEVDLKGGTDVDFSPPLDFLQRVLVPTVGRMGVEVSLDCDARGFFPKGGGHLGLWVTGLQGPLKPIDIGERGSVTRIAAVCYATPADGWLNEEDTMRTMEEFEPWLMSELADKGGKAPKCTVECNPEPSADGRTFMAAFEIVVETSTGGMFHGSSGAMEWKRNHGLYDIWYAAAEKALKPLKPQLASGAALDEHLVDQLILPASLAKGTSRILGAKELTLHAQTAIHIAEKMVPGVSFTVTNPKPNVTLIECTGIGRAPGAPPMQPPKGEEEVVVAKFPPGSLSEVAPEERWVADLRNDLGLFSAKFGVESKLEMGRDRIFVTGPGISKDDGWKTEMSRLLEYYELKGVQWR